MKKNRQLKATWVAKEMLEVFKARPHWPAKDIHETIKRAYKVLVKKSFAYKVKYHAHKLLHGSMQDHYLKLGIYIEAIKQTSPDTVLDLVVDTSKKSNPPTFQRLFTCYEGLAMGWKEGCRRIICIDAAFLKTFLGGQILSAVGRDANEQMFPIAWAAVEGENNSFWVWFITHLQTSLDLGDGTGLAIVSDEHLAILHAVAIVLPMAEHRHCARHVFAHWHKHFRGDDMKLKFWRIAKSYSMADYNESLDELEKENSDAAASFRAYNPYCFCRAFMSDEIRSDAITNNMAETFNGYIVNARTKHLIYMLEDIRVALMQRLVTKDKKWRSLIVNLEDRTFTCKKWDKLGVPCCHAVACIEFLNKEAEFYVDECYRKEVYLRTYAAAIPPIEGERHWPRVECKLDPPPIKVGPGRPRRNRIRDAYEDPKRPGQLTRHGIEMTCTLCREKGHNKRGCPKKDTAQPLEPPAKKQRGRPKNLLQLLQKHQHPTIQSLHSLHN
ncbi:uncharacterized protein LOC104908513 [Beta vulgaris subsp. vulgaris]|uniref:uncharacterized protein LOC104908513 n=1 Tax=Beta vulgaris subsp. vulgaris TaxID=3555 RepID=UPI002549170B|nr:uncharacterized protein LOC104908513 [Beta vulgaris subsp. vulgaris]